MNGTWKHSRLRDRRAQCPKQSTFLSPYRKHKETAARLGVSYAAVITGRTSVNADKKKWLTKIDDNKTELLTKVGNDKKELLTKLGLDKKELLTRIDLERGTRIKVEDGLRRLINDVKHDVDQKIPHIQELLATLRREFDSTNTRLIEPNEAYLGSLGSLFVIVFQLQTLFESLNQSDRSSPLQFEWFCNIKDFLERHLNGEGSKKPSSA